MFQRNIIMKPPTILTWNLRKLVSGDRDDQRRIARDGLPGPCWTVWNNDYHRRLSLCLSFWPIFDVDIEIAIVLGRVVWVTQKRLLQSFLLSDLLWGEWILVFSLTGICQKLIIKCRALSYLYLHQDPLLIESRQEGAKKSALDAIVQILNLLCQGKNCSGCWSRKAQVSSRPISPSGWKRSP